MIAEWLLRKFVGDSSDASDPAVRRACGLLEGWVSIAVNLLVSAVKLVFAGVTGSVSLMADAFHSLGDVGSSVVILWSFRSSARPADREHPFGYGNAESVGAMVLAVLLLVAALEFVRSSVTQILSPGSVTASWVIIGVLGATAAVKEWLTGFSLALGRRFGSAALVAEAWHHRSDVLATLVVMAALAGSRFGLPALDGFAGLAVAGFVAAAGWKMVKRSAGLLIGSPPPPELIQRIRRAAVGVPGVEKAHDVIVHAYGDLVIASLHVEVPSTIDVIRGHEIAEEAETAVMRETGGWATVHVDPVVSDHPLFADMDRFLRATIPRIAGARGFHDLRIVGREDPCYVILDLSAEADEGRVAREVRDAVLDSFPTVAKVVVNIEPRWVY